tara:strand:- start:26332 stop:26664 length:333 start_codon:yes stop_codon:yes gene_type:complete
MLSGIEINLNDLKKNILNESYVAQFAAQIKYLLWHLSAPDFFKPPTNNIKITGNKRDVENFTKVLGKEKKYMDAYLAHGLGDPKVQNNKYSLQRAVQNFELETGLTWPIK